jgi:PII-like signaling protein
MRDAMPVVVIKEEKEKTHNIKNETSEKTENHFISYDKCRVVVSR